MGRLIDADALLKEIEETAIEVENARSGETIKKAFLQCLATVREGIIRTPTAYDVEKVVEELEKEKEIHTNHYNISIYKDFPEIKQRYKQTCGVIKKSIDIVKRGGVE